MSVRNILIIDDDERLRELLAEYLTQRGFSVRQAVDGEAGARAVKGESFDLVVLDIMLPGQDGFETCREIRKSSEVPIIMLTARGEELDRIVGLELGADDYMPKPFNPRELLARIQAILRRTQARSLKNPTISAGPLRVDIDKRVVTLNDEIIDLTTTEFEILRILVANAGRVIPRERLMELARGDEFATFERSVDVHISRIRKKLGDDSKKPRFVKTVRSIGYLMPQDPQ